MKRKTIAIVLVLIITIALLAVFFMNHINRFHQEDLYNPKVQTDTISIYGKWLFHVNRDALIYNETAKNLETGESVFLGLGSWYSPTFYKDSMFYIAANELDTATYLYKRNINGFFSKKLVSDKIRGFNLKDNYLYYSKASYAGDKDYPKNGYIFRINLDTMKKELVIKQNTKQYRLKDDKILYTVKIKDSYDKYKEILSDGIYCYSVTDKTETLIIKGLIERFNLGNNHIIYTNYSLEANENSKEVMYELYILNLDEIESIKLCDNVKDFKINNQYYCYVDKETPNTIYAGSLVDGHTESIKANGNIENFRLYDNNICLIDNISLHKMYIYNLSSKRITEVDVTDIDADAEYVLCDGMVYYYNTKGKLCECSIN